MKFKNRAEAGTQLAEALSRYKGKEVVIYALPRGGVPLAAEVATRLNVPLDLVITRKIGHPYNPEYAICAAAEGGELVCNEAERAQVDQGWFTREVKSEVAEAKRRRQVYLGRESLSPKGTIAILVDDGIATGLSMLAAVGSVQKQGAKQVVVAVPVVPADTAKLLEHTGAKVIALEIPRNFLGSVGAYYEDFKQVSDQEVIDLLKSVN